MKIDIVHPNLYKITKPGAVAQKYKLGVQDVAEKEAKKLIDRGAAKSIEAEPEAKPAPVAAKK